jgi:hypothetical protein
VPVVETASGGGEVVVAVAEVALPHPGEGVRGRGGSWVQGRRGNGS